jgi:hypothetical protein
MAGKLQLQRDTKVFFSINSFVDGDAPSVFTPANTYEISVLSGFSLSKSSGTQDINAIESGLNPDRSSRRFNINVQPVDWSFQAYIRPLAVSILSNGRSSSDWFLWQSLITNTAPAVGSQLQSVQGSFISGYGTGVTTATRGVGVNIAAGTTKFGVAQENHLYFQLDNIVYQVANATVDSVEVNGSIDTIASATWAGKGINLVELTGANRDNAISVFGGILNSGASVTPNSNCLAMTLASSFHPWDQANNSGTIRTASFIKNRLGSLNLYHNASGTVENYTFPLTKLSFSYKNNLTYLTPEEMSKLNQPIGQFTGAQELTATVSAYLRTDPSGSAQFLRNILSDTRPHHSFDANAELALGIYNGSSGSIPSIRLHMPAVQFDIPTHNIEDIVSIDINMKAQEPLNSESTGYIGHIHWKY